MIATAFASTLRRSFRVGLAAAALAAGFAATPGFAANGTNASSPIFYVPLNRSELITTNTDIGEVIITDPTVANVVVHGKRNVSIFGVSVGQTTLRIFDINHKLVRSTDVSVTYDLPAIRRALKEFLPNERIGVSMVNTRIALTGEVANASSAASAMEIAEEFVRGKLNEKDAAIRVVKDGSTNDSPVINLMKISSGQQVMLRIRIGEVQRNAVRNLGISLQAFGDSGSVFSLGTGIGRALTTTATTAVTGLVDTTTSTPAVTGHSYTTTTTVSNPYGTFTPSSDAFADASIRTHGRQGVGAALEALERDGLLKTLAEPTLTALSGEEAQFLAGGEFPIPVPQQQGAVTIQYKSFGVALKFIPYVLSKNRIRIQVQPEVSETSSQNQAVISGFVAPSIVTRRASTTVELAPGESFMLAGLLCDDASSTIDQLPGAGDLPILGALFRSTAYQRQETELVISVTPYLVDPIKDGDIKLPTDDFRPPSFIESVFWGAVVSNKGAKDPSPEGPTGFMTDN